MLMTLFYKNVGRPIYLAWISHLGNDGPGPLEIGSRERSDGCESDCQVYVCALDGLSYDNTDGITAHMKLQHGIERLESSLVRERGFA
jgi:hypothetical protein